MSHQDLLAVAPVAMKFDNMAAALRGVTRQIPSLQHVRFYRGTEASKLNRFNRRRILTDAVDMENPAQPCADYFLKALAHDFAIFSFLCHRESLRVANAIEVSENLDNAVLQNNLRVIMHECRRLKNAPHLFPSELLKQKFLTNIAS